MQWLRLYHDTPNDPKWRLVAVESEQTVANVLAVWMHMMVCASAAKDRGTLEEWDDRIVAASIGIKAAAVTAIRDAMQGLVLEGDKLTGWEKRQFPSDTSAERTRRYRAKNAENDGGSGGDGGGSSQKSNGVDKCYGDGDVTSQDGSVTSQTVPVTVDVTSPPLRATDSRFTEEDSVASATAPPAAPARPLKSVLFGECLKWLTEGSGRPESQLRKMIGRWCRDYGEGAVLEAISIAQRDAAVSPVGYVEKILKSRDKGHGKSDGSKHDALIHGLAGAFSDLMDPGSEAPSGDSGAIARRYH